MFKKYLKPRHLSINFNFNWKLKSQKCSNGNLTDEFLIKAFLFGTDIPPCTDYEVDQFPLRMRDWLKNILIQYYERDLNTSGILTEKQRNKVSNPFQIRPCSYMEQPRTSHSKWHELGDF